MEKNKIKIKTSSDKKKRVLKVNSSGGMTRVYSIYSKQIKK
jgi:hypothetical protein